MRAVVQRADGARVSVDDVVADSFDGPVLVVFLGVTHGDQPSDSRTLAQKVAHLRIMAEEQSLVQVAGTALVISQFTLYADTKKGRRPSWSNAAPGEVAQPLYEHFCSALEECGVKVARGVFGAHMRVEFTNDGPVTIILES